MLPVEFRQAPSSPGILYFGMTLDRIHGSVQSAPFICGP